MKRSFLSASRLHLGASYYPEHWGDVHIVINHNPTSCTVNMPWPSFDHLNGISLSMDFDLAGYSVAVLTPDEKRI
jgi:hypothetical protein